MCVYVAHRIYVPVLIGQPNWFEMCNFLNACLGFAGLGEEGNYSAPLTPSILASCLLMLLVEGGGRVRCCTLELLGEIGGEEGAARWGRCVEGRGMYGCSTPVPWVCIWIWSSNLWAAFLELHCSWYPLVSVLGLALVFSVAQIKAKFILSTDDKTKKGSQYLGEWSMNSYICFKAESWLKNVDQIQ